MTHKNIQLYFYIALLVVVFAFNVAIFSPFIKLLTVVAILAVIFYPIYKRIQRSFIKNTNLASFVTILIVIIIVLIPITFFTTQVFHEAKDFYNNIESSNNSLQAISGVINEKLSVIVPNSSVNLSSYFTTLSSKLTSSLGGIFSSVFNYVSIFLLGLILLYFFLRDGNKFIHKLVKFSPLDDAHDNKILSKLKKTITSIVKGSLVIACIQGLLAWFGFFIFDLPSPALWGGLSVFASLIPGIGTALVLGPAVAYLFSTSTLFNAVGLLVWGVVIVGLVDNIVRPYLVGQEVDIHPLIVLVSIFGGLIMFGAVGLILGPLLLSFFSVLVELYPVITKTALESK